MDFSLEWNKNASLNEALPSLSPRERRGDFSPAFQRRELANSTERRVSDA
ncbi:MAG: hypothetical protein WCB68_19150 [Pyrinomonadaceae bacterium]